MRDSAAKPPGRDRRKDAADPVARTPETDQEGHTEQVNGRTGCKYSEIVWLPMGRIASTSTNADALTGLPNTYHRLAPDPDTAPVVKWMFAQRLAGHSAARITRALNDAGISDSS
jgi:hypothetical protein